MQYDMSIIVSIHGRIDLLKETVQSLEMQNYDNFEVIFTDDTVCESERKKIKELLSSFTKPYRYIFTNPNLGQVGNTNQGLREANGRYVRILHSDDLLHPETIGFEIGILDKYKEQTSFLYHDRIIFNNNIDFHQYETTETIRQPKDILREIVNLRKTAIPSAMVMSQEFLQKLGLMNEEYPHACDNDLFVRQVLLSYELNEKIIYVGKKYVAWRTHNDSVTAYGLKSNIEEQTLLVESILDIFNEKNIINNYEKTYYLNNAIIVRFKFIIWNILGRNTEVTISQIIRNIFMTYKIWLPRIFSLLYALISAVPLFIFKHINTK